MQKHESSSCAGLVVQHEMSGTTSTTCLSGFGMDAMFVMTRGLRLLHEKRRRAGLVFRLVYCLPGQDYPSALAWFAHYY